MTEERLGDVAAPPAELPEEAAAGWTGTRVDGVEVLGALSPSRAADFRSCPLLYRFRTIDRLPEPASPAAVRGTVVHKVLEQLFDLPALARTPERAADLVQGAWDEVLATDPAAAELFDGGPVDEATPVGDWLASCHEVLQRYFDLEDPRALEPTHREEYVETLLDSKLLLRGIVDRIDVAPDGAIRVVDYKTGRSPGVGFEASALFQMRFYALVIWRTRGVVPALLRLIYLGNGELVSYQPDEADLRATERLLVALWEAIRRARETGDWQPSPGRSCTWCAHQALCPAFGGTPPPLPGPEVSRATRP
ncbi:MAG: PD-(D/E)XK nuclease family protein [Marmoricola sp.]